MSRSLFCIVALLGLGLSGPVLAQGAGDQDKRLERLEEQMVDLNAQIGTIESMGRGGGGGGGGAPVASGFSGGGGDDAQIRALSSQLNEMMRRLERLEARLGAAPPPSDGPNYGDARPRGNERQGRARPAEQGTGFSIGGLDDDQDNNTASAPPPLQQRGSSPPPNSGGSSSGGGFFSGLLGGGSSSSDRSEGAAPNSNSGSSSGWSTQPAPLTPGGRPGADAGPSTSGGAPVRTASLTSPQAQSAYDQAYGAYQQQNIRAATSGFEQFLQRYPGDPLAGSAQFLLGEAAFTSGDYRKAADMYLKTATNYPDNDKAAESMLKLGISLKRLGENDAACSTFNEMGKRYPNASALLQRADTEKRRSSC
jgi:tol-pal system protein YbgF